MREPIVLQRSSCGDILCGILRRGSYYCFKFLFVREQIPCVDTSTVEVNKEVTQDAAAGVFVVKNNRNFVPAFVTFVFKMKAEMEYAILLEEP